jgi:urate oxidase
VAAELGPNRYGKAAVHVATVARRGDRHDFFERLVDARLEGDFEPVHLEGDNSSVLPTDTMRGSVYALAKGHADEEIEPFALRYTAYLLEASPAATKAEAWVSERPWERVVIDGQPHPHAFTRGAFRRTARVVRTRDGVWLWAGLDEFYVLKTTGSAFSGFLRDRFTTLPETDDRVMATKLDAAWLYGLTDLDYRGVRDRVRDVLVSTFARHDESRSVQHTLWEMGRAAIEACPEVEEIRFSLPNLHHILVDLSPCGLDNQGEVFVVTDKPSGQIEGTVRRSRDDAAPPP